MATAPTALTLNSISAFAADQMKASQDKLITAYSTLGPDSSPAELLAFQAQLSINSTTTSIQSAIVKTWADDIKGVVQKF